MRSILRYIFDLGFSSSEVEVGAPPLEGGAAGSSRIYMGRRGALRCVTWDLYSWLALASGIFLRSGIQLPSLVWKVDALTWQSFLAALVVSLAAFGWFMRWLNKGGKRSGLQLFSAPFAFGFVLSLGEFGVKSLIPRHI